MSPMVSGRVDHAFAHFSYRYDILMVELTEWPAIEFSDLADVGRALKKRHPGKVIMMPAYNAETSDNREFSLNKSRFDELTIDALRVLGVSDMEIENVKVYEGSMGGDYRKTLRNAELYGERYLVGKSLLQHHNPFYSVGTNYDMDVLAEELIERLGWHVADGGRRFEPRDRRG